MEKEDSVDTRNKRKKDSVETTPSDDDREPPSHQRRYASSDESGSDFSDGDTNSTDDPNDYLYGEILYMAYADEDDSRRQEEETDVTTDGETHQNAEDPYSEDETEEEGEDNENILETAEDAVLDLSAQFAVVNEYSPKFSDPPAMDPMNNNFFTYRISVDDKMSFSKKFEKFLQEEWLNSVACIIFGGWDRRADKSPSKFLRLLSQNKTKLRNLRGIYVGDFKSKEAKLSYIKQGDITDILNSFPQLTHLKVRGAIGLVFDELTHPSLQSLTIESCCLSSKAVSGICRSTLPKLERLELWLGSDEHGGLYTYCASVEQLQPLFNHGDRFPLLKHLALKNTTETNDIVENLVDSDLLCQLETLDLSLGTLDDEVALYMTNLAIYPNLRVVVHHHFCSDPVIRKLEDTLQGRFVASGQHIPPPYIGVNE